MNGPRSQHTTCPRCGAPCLRQPDGTLLNPQPERYAIHLPDGSRLDARTALPIITGQQPPRAHHRHTSGPYGCNPPAALTLF